MNGPALPACRMHSITPVSVSTSARRCSAVGAFAVMPVSRARSAVARSRPTPSRFLPNAASDRTWGRDPVAGNRVWVPSMMRKLERSLPKNCSRYSRLFGSFASMDALVAMMRSCGESGVRPSRASSVLSR